MITLMNMGNQAVHFVTDTLNVRLSNPAKRIATALIILGGIIGLAEVLSLLWKKLQPIQQRNPREEAVNRVYQSNLQNPAPSGQTHPIQSFEPIQNPGIENPHLENPQEEYSVEIDKPISPEDQDNEETVDTVEDLEASDSKPLENVASEMDDTSQLSPTDLLVLRAFCKKGKATRIGEFYVWYDYQRSLINIQDANHYQRNNENKLSFVIDDEGKIASLYENDSPLNPLQIPSHFIARLKESIQHAFKNTCSFTSSNYSNNVFISTVRKGIKAVPEYHLAEICQRMRQGENFNIANVNFLESHNLQTTEGIDGGGLSRGYVTDLFEGLLKSPLLSFYSTPTFAFPQTKEKFVSSDCFPKLNNQENEIYTNIGKMMMHIYTHSAAYYIGPCFHPALFSAALCLTKEEIYTPFNQLSIETKLKMCRALMTGFSESGMSLAYLNEILNSIDALSSLSTDKERKSEAVKIAQILLDSCRLGAQFIKENEQKEEEVDKEKIFSQMNEFQKHLIDLVFSEKGDERGQFGAQLAPIHAIAQGMAFVKYNPMNRVNDQTLCQDYKQFCERVQGSLDRNVIADHIMLSMSQRWKATSKQIEEVEKKIGWLKEWIKKEASEEEIKKFLYFISDSTTFPKNQTISVNFQSPSSITQKYAPWLVAHTCSYEIEIAPESTFFETTTGTILYEDLTKEGFINAIKAYSFKTTNSTNEDSSIGYQMS